MPPGGRHPDRPKAGCRKRRLLVAEQLLTDTASGVTDVAFAAGFNSLRRSGALFKERYGVSPQQMTRSRGVYPRPEAAPACRWCA
jgi:AraC family transcriptional regulator of adaptative response / DNA-3-methyladenine glycosylase II